MRTAQGRLVHAMMQPGTGSVDAIVGVGEPAASYQVNGSNELGYRFAYDFTVNCQLDESFTLSTGDHGARPAKRHPRPTRIRPGRLWTT